MGGARRGATIAEMKVARASGDVLDLPVEGVRYWPNGLACTVEKVVGDPERESE